MGLPRFPKSERVWERDSSRGEETRVRCTRFLRRSHYPRIPKCIYFLLRASYRILIVYVNSTHIMTVRRELYIILIMANLQNMLCLIGYVIHKGVNKVLLGHVTSALL